MEYEKAWVVFREVAWGDEPKFIAIFSSEESAKQEVEEQNKGLRSSDLRFHYQDFQILK